jgi:hypothetical protein
MATELEVTITELGIMLAKLDDRLPSSRAAAAKQRAPTAEGAPQALTSAEGTSQARPVRPPMASKVL